MGGRVIFSNGNWAEAQNMGGKINSSNNEVRPFVTNDQKYLFFVSDRTQNLRLSEDFMTLSEVKNIINTPAASNTQNVYWIDAKVIDELRQNNPGK